MIDNNCPVCGKPQASPRICRVNDFDVFRCDACHADYVFPMPSDAFLKDFYDRSEWFEGGESGGYDNYDSQTLGSVQALEPILRSFAPAKDLSVLDVGCGYGSHLELASRLGWKCFGVEVSTHARQVASQRLAGKAFITETISDQIPHAFDLILLLDVIEHITSPYTLFYSLFSIGAITPKTRVVISTPNASSLDAQRDPGAWKYRHPPSHLVNYTPRTLRYLLEKLQFANISVTGTYAIQTQGVSTSDIASFEGLMADANGSNFTEFMRERYVPGTWSKIAAYEHLPRYEFARQLVKGKTVLDFGCGTGYGSALLAEASASVTGLDIDETALAWARQTHARANLQFCRSMDLGAELAAASFDAITCFEMIEHVDIATQHAAIASMARLIREDGLLIISTPNPEVTKLYGENPFHLREMDLVEFKELLGIHFPYVRIVEQRVRLSISFDRTDRSLPSAYPSAVPDSGGVPALAFVAICSKVAPHSAEPFIVFDQETDPIHDLLTSTSQRNTLGLRTYALGEQLSNKSAELQAVSDHAERLAQVLQLQVEIASGQALEIQRQEKLIDHEYQAKQLLEQDLARQGVQLERLNSELQAVLQSNWHRLGHTLRERPVSVRSIAHTIYLLALIFLPRYLTNKLRSLAHWRRKRPGKVKEICQGGEKPQHVAAYAIKQPEVVERDRPLILHVLANFNIGGSSRLVVDLIENLGHGFDQRVLTSFVPDPPAYTNLDITEIRHPLDLQPFVELYQRVKPDALHVHYWGDVDEPWYRKAFEAAEMLQIQVIENVNTPVKPYYSKVVSRYVYVSDYVRRTFGATSPSHITIYPGSDFEHFARSNEELSAGDCVGMVYRLESDKLSQEAILPFILAVKKCPRLKVLIVGGGSLLASFRHAVQAEDLAGSFEFTGYVSYEQLPALYRRMAIFVAPVWKESFGQVSAFAMNMGIPVCGYDVGAIGEILENPSLVAPAADAQGLSDIIVRLMDSPIDRAAIGHALHMRAQSRFSLESMISAYQTTYQQLTQKQVR